MAFFSLKAKRRGFWPKSGYRTQRFIIQWLEIISSNQSGSHFSSLRQAWIEFCFRKLKAQPVFRAIYTRSSQASKTVAEYHCFDNNCHICVFYRTMSCRTGSEICMTTDTLLMLGTQTTGCRHHSRAASSCTTLLLSSSLPAPVSTPQLISHRWMCMRSRQILQLSCANHHPQKRELWHWRTSWNV